jgi:hypothetical protein
MLIGVERLLELVQTTILTGRVSDMRPVSLLLIAAPESGKTSIVLQQPCEQVAVLNDVTGRGLQLLCQMKAEISHFVLTDLTTVGAHKSSVARYTMSTLTAITEEGLTATAVGGQIETYQHGRRGIIGCLTASMAKDKRAWWNRIGLASRMLPFSYVHSTPLVIKIKASIDKNQRGKEPEVFITPKAPIEVRFGAKETTQIRQLADIKANELKEIGYRRLKQFRALAAAHSLLRHKHKVDAQDVQFIESLQPYISYTDAKSL